MVLLKLSDPSTDIEYMYVPLGGLIGFEAAVTGLLRNVVTAVSSSSAEVTLNRVNDDKRLISIRL